MKRAFLLIGLLAVNAVAVVVLLARFSDKTTAPAGQSAAVSTTDNNLAARAALAEEHAVQVPPRPEIVVHDPSSPRQVEIAALRTAAFEVAEETVQRLVDDPAALCLLGKLHLRSGDGESARSLWDQALMLDPRSAEAYLDYGHYELNKGEFAKAADYFRAALRNAPATFEAHRLLGQALLAQGDAGGAAAEFDRFLTRAPQAPTEERAGAWAKLGNAYQRLGKFEEAARSYSMAFELEPTSSEAANGLLVAYRKLGQPEKSAQYAEVLERLSAPEPTVTDNREDRDVDLHKAQGVLDYTCQTSTTLLAKHGDMETAVRLLEEALAAAPRLDSLRSQLVTLHVRRGSDDDAIRVLTQGCEAEPENLQAWLGLAKFCMQRRRMGAAESALQKVIELEPEAADGYALLAQVQMTDRSTVQAAVATARKAVARLQSGGNYYILATALYHAGDRAGSREALLKALELEPANAEYRSALSRL